MTPLYENGVWYDQDGSPFRCDVKSRGEFGLTKIYLYRWNSPGGFTGIDHVYVNRYEDFLALLAYWNRSQTWGYYEHDTR